MRVPYFDGFVGTLNAGFHTELVESLPGADNETIPSFFVRLWKLHGSLNWVWNDSGQVVRIGQAAPEGLPAVIYPSDAKYHESRRVPFLVLHDRFRRALHQAESLVLISGYSFVDEHLNELIFDAATRRQRSEFVAFLYSDIPAPLAERAEITPNLQIVSRREAIIGGIRADWKEPEDAWPDVWAAIIGGIRADWKEPEDAWPDVWAEGQFLLPDFKFLARHLARSTQNRYEGDSNLRALLREAIGEAPVQDREEVDV